MFTPKEISETTLARPEEKYDKEYSKERQEIRKYIREDDQSCKTNGGVIDWGIIDQPRIFLAECYKD